MLAQKKREQNSIAILLETINQASRSLPQQSIERRASYLQTYQKMLRRPRHGLLLSCLSVFTIHSFRKLKELIIIKEGIKKKSQMHNSTEQQQQQGVAVLGYPNDRGKYTNS
jgi:hypothetical protein